MIYMLRKHKKDMEQTYVQYILYMHNVNRGLSLLLNKLRK